MWREVKRKFFHFLSPFIHFIEYMVYLCGGKYSVKKKSERMMGWVKKRVSVCMRLLLKTKKRVEGENL